MAISLIGLLVLAVLLMAGAAVVILGGVWLFDRNKKTSIEGSDE